MDGQLDIRSFHRRNLLRMDALGDQDGIPSLLPSFRQHQHLQKFGLLHHGSEHSFCRFNLDHLLLAMHTTGCILSPRAPPHCQMLGQVNIGLRPRSICKSPSHSQHQHNLTRTERLHRYPHRRAADPPAVENPSQPPQTTYAHQHRQPGRNRSPYLIPPDDRPPRVPKRN
jgi:hypothetical protein